MSDSMTFPDTVEEFMEQYKIVDTDGIYMSKGAELVPIFRMRQWFEHLPSAQQWTPITEGLPNSQEPVIVSVQDDSGDTRFNYTASGWITPDKEYWIVDDEVNYYVIAWMPMPEPWKGEK